MQTKISKDDRTILSSELLTENSLLVISKKGDNKPSISICYEEKDELKEDTISELDERTTVERTDRIIAVFKEVTCLGIPRPMLSKIYDLHYHKFVRDDMLHTVYKLRTKENPKVKQLLNKGGLITWQKM